MTQHLDIHGGGSASDTYDDPVKCETPWAIKIFGSLLSFFPPQFPS